MINTLVDANPFTTLCTLAKWKLFQKDESWPSDLKKLQQQLPITKPVFNTFSDKIVYTWIGHSTAVISIGKQFNVLIDPVFSQRASMSQSIGPKRFRAPACTIQQLPKIDLVVVSHDHYDHLDQNSLEKLYQRNNNTVFAAGLNSKDVFPQNCILEQFDWTQSKIVKVNQNSQVKLTFVPVCHWGRRGAFDKNLRLWGGFVLQTKNNTKIFYLGDTGKCGIFEQLGKQFHHFDLSILPIGAYEPRKYLKNQHVNPEQAVQVHKQINSKKSVGVHWGTFPLGSEHYTAARRDLKEAVKKYGLRQDQFVAIGHGEQLIVDL